MALYACENPSPDICCICHEILQVVEIRNFGRRKNAPVWLKRMLQNRAELAKKVQTSKKAVNEFMRDQTTHRTWKEHQLIIRRLRHIHWKQHREL